MNKLMQCVPNFSEGRDKEKIDKIVESFRNKDKVKLLDYGYDTDHNRLVVTAVGAPAELKAAVVEAIGKAVELIDMTKHEGQHPRMGAVDVVPFIPIKNTTMKEADALANQVAETVGRLYDLPVFLYEKPATAPIARIPPLFAKASSKDWWLSSNSPSGYPTLAPFTLTPRPEP